MLDESGLGYVEATVTKGDFEDGGAVGVFTFVDPIPAGAVTLRAVVTDVTRFADAAGPAELEIGDGRDPQRYAAGKFLLSNNVDILPIGEPLGLREHVAATYPVLKITAPAGDFSLIPAGGLACRVYFLAGA